MEILQISSLEKVFADTRSTEVLEKTSCLANEKINWQIAICTDKNTTVKYSVISEEAERVTVRHVGFVPAAFLAYEPQRGDYLRTTPGMYPDVLEDPGKTTLKMKKDAWESLYITYDPTGTEPGEKKITVRVTAGKEVLEKTMKVKVLRAELPGQEILVTEWFHVDSIAEVYHEEVFSPSNMRHIRSFLKVAAESGINTILTPLFTPPLDTEVGKERLTVQLIGVEKTETGYKFDFRRLGRWVKMCHEVGITHFEMSHLFTQWGAAHAPKIMAKFGDHEERIFGWETEAGGEDYREFLAAFLPKLIKYLKRLGIEKNCFFHISDEPSQGQIENYNIAKAGTMPWLKDFTIMDALSDWDLYSQGAVKMPVIAIGAANYFVEHGHKNPWVYYCCGQQYGCSNRHFCMHLLTTRAISTQFFKFNCGGFLQWGYNFYHTQLSKEVIDPYKVSDAGAKFPAGDAFSVYPGRHGALESIRLSAFTEGLRDLRMMKLLETKIGHEKTVKLMEKGLDEPVHFCNIPTSDEWYIAMRERLHKEIAKYFG